MRYFRNDKLSGTKGRDNWMDKLGATNWTLQTERDFSSGDSYGMTKGRDKQYGFFQNDNKALQTGRYKLGVYKQGATKAVEILSE
ncbi:hypothetical protein [Chryseobacterium sp. 6424]|uniref:hypothetical protein n=1 Tax=Chryseobacterium sp. 6424 TaxID=2039166 RepID=UPI0013CEE22B|nr:hypothetical protein [Chryseobacterium sp. 6424]